MSSIDRAQFSTAKEAASHIASLEARAVALEEALGRIANDFDNFDGVYELKRAQEIAREALATGAPPSQVTETGR